MTLTAISDATALDLRKLNSASQYPAILTYHKLGERGRLTETLNVDFGDIPADQVEVTEKVDGANARIIIPPASVGAPIIGSRTELLHYAYDVIHNPTEGIVDAVRATAGRLTASGTPELLTVVFGEVYGGRTGSNWKQYSTTGATGFRVFDVAVIPITVLDWDIEQIARWRNRGGQEFMPAKTLSWFTEWNGLPTVPRLLVDGQAPVPPVEVAYTHAWLARLLPETRAALDDTGRKRGEGVVVRTADRSRIAKIRFDDYERTARAAA